MSAPGSHLTLYRGEASQASPLVISGLRPLLGPRKAIIASLRAGFHERQRQKGGCSCVHLELVKLQKGREETLGRKKAEEWETGPCACVCYVSLCEYSHMCVQMHGHMYVYRDQS